MSVNGRIRRTRELTGFSHSVHVCSANGCQVFEPHAIVAPLKDGRKDARVGPPQRLEWNGRVLERLVCRHQKEALLWIHTARLRARDAKELGVKVGDVVLDEVAVPCTKRRSSLGICVVPFISVPAVFRYFDVAAATLGQEGP